MKRRLDLAAALMHNPEVLFLDEPTTGLDPTSRPSVWSEVRRLNAELGMTIFLTTQYLEEADVLADRVGIIAGGRLVAEGPPEVLKRSIGQDVIVVEAEGDDAERARRAAADRRSSTQRRRRRRRRSRSSTSDSASALGPVAVALSRTGLQVRSLTVRTPTLDDVFRQLTGIAHRRDGGATAVADGGAGADQGPGERVPARRRARWPDGRCARSPGSRRRCSPPSSSPPSSTR